ncbi:FkbM family methyltransferase [Halomontanus rarus]|uniref:FkbM family methyltransferase n=1 Tax=Halomontanus rarus TaxID=3034020 RepID=UPI001A994C30
MTNWKAVASNAVSWSVRFSGWWKIFLNRAGLYTSPFSLRVRGTSKKYWVGDTDAEVLDEYYCCGEYDAVNWSAFDTVVDVGSHIGVIPVNAHKYVEKVICYEPHPATYNLLRQNIVENGIHNVSTYNKAVAAESGEVYLHESETSLGHSIVTPFDGETLAVEATTLQQIVFCHDLDGRTLLKLDCEGAEFSIIANSSESLQAFDGILIEYHCEAGEPERLVQHLRSAGFTLHKKVTGEGRGLLYAGDIGLVADSRSSGILTALEQTEEVDYDKERGVLW